MCLVNVYTNIDSYNHKRQLAVAPNDTINGYDKRIEGNCYSIQNKFNGFSQWGNAMYFYMFSIMYLLRNGASVVILKSLTTMPICTHLADVVYGPNANSYNENDCLEWDPSLWYRSQGAMQDIMDLRRDWDTLTVNWPKNDKSSPRLNLNPFLPYTGVVPSLVEVAMTESNVDWNDVLVLHIRQGDVMSNAYAPHFLFLHSQPPCAYYEDAIETGFVNGTAFPYILITTNPQKDEMRKNPCAKYLHDRYTSGLYPNTKVLDYNQLISGFTETYRLPTRWKPVRLDLHILIEAVNLAEGHSTFTMGTTMLNTKLKRHFVPANPSTINCVHPLSTTLHGDYVYKRQYYSKDLIQIQYLLPDWFGFSPTCNEIEMNQVKWWRIGVTEHMKKMWDTSKENIQQKMLDYPRGLLIKYKTSNKPFQCKSTENPLIAMDRSKWFAPCICNEDVIDHILSS